MRERAMNGNKRYYVPTQVLKWGDVRVAGMPIRVNGRSVGYLEAFNSREEAHNEYPEAQIIVFEEADIKENVSKRDESIR